MPLPLSSISKMSGLRPLVAIFDDPINGLITARSWSSPYATFISFFTRAIKFGSPSWSSQQSSSIT